jgi:hypothetical protein
LASALGRAAASLRADRAVCRCDCIPLLDPAQRVPLRVRHTYPRHTRGEEASSSHPPFCALTTSISAHSGTHTHHTHRGTKLTLVLPYLSPPGLARISQSQIEFSVGTSSHVLAKHFDFTVRRSCAHIPRTPLRTLHQLLGLPRRSTLPNPCSRRANLTICTCLLAQGWQSTSMVSILNKRSCCWVLQLRPRSDFGRLVHPRSKPLGGARAVHGAVSNRARRVLHL